MRKCSLKMGGEKFRVPVSEVSGFAGWWGVWVGRTGLSAEKETAQTTLATVVNRAGELQLRLFKYGILLAVQP